MSRFESVSAFAPASIGNVAVGFDMLGLAISGVGDRVCARRCERPGVRIAQIFDPQGQPHQDLSRECDQNTASIAAQALWDDHGPASPDSKSKHRFGLELTLHKGVPLRSGMGSSAASAVAAVVAANALLEQPLERHRLLPYALKGEQFASGSLHADNVAPSLLGGLVLCPTALLPRVMSVALPQGISSVLIHPELEINTASARQCLASHYSMQDWLTQQGFLASFLLACGNNDHSLIRASLKDVLIEPQRSQAVSCFEPVKHAAIQFNAMGASLSGSGPSIFALCSDNDAPQIAAAMVQACRGTGIDCQYWISPMTAAGAHVESAQ